MEQKDLYIALFKCSKENAISTKQYLRSLYKSSEVKNFSCFDRLAKSLKEHQSDLHAVIINLDETSEKISTYLKKLREKNPEVVISAYSFTENDKLIKTFYKNSGNIFFVIPPTKAEKENILFQLVKIIIKTYTLQLNREYLIFRLN